MLTGSGGGVGRHGVEDSLFLPRGHTHDTEEQFTIHQVYIRYSN